MRRFLRSNQRLLWWVGLGVVVVVGCVGRLWNVDFDDRQHQHPDERYWSIVSDALDQAPPVETRSTVFGPLVDWLDADVSPANPYRVVETFPYGPVTLAVSRGTAGWLRAGIDDGDQPASTVASALDAMGIPLIAADGQARFDDAYQVDLIGRVVGALIDACTIIVVGLIARKLAGRAAALVGAVLYAASPLALQHAHFLGAEPLVGLGCGLTVLAALHLDRGGSSRRAAVSGARVGVAAGVAVAAKLSGASVAIVPVAGAVALAVAHRRASDLVRVASMVAGVFVAFRIIQPSAFAGLSPFPSRAFLDDIERLRSQFDGDSPPSIQWAGQSGGGQALSWLVQFTVGPGTALLAAAGAIAMMRRLWRSRTGVATAERWSAMVVLASLIVPFVYVIVTAVPSGRYFMPLLPTVCALGGVGGVAAWERARAAEPTRWARGAQWAVGGAVAISVLWGVMFVNGVYGSEYTRTAASRWIVDHVPDGSVITSQAWDDGLPLLVPGVDPTAYTSVQLNMVGTDHHDKVVQVVRQLRDVDFVVESSPRLWATVTQIPERFPSTIAFFEALDDGRLGFERVATFDSDPSLGPLRLDDGNAEEAFSVYDHPEVRIWQKARTVEVADMLDVLDPRAADRALSVRAGEAASGGLLLTDAERGELRDTPTYDEQFAGGPGWAHAVGWWLVVELLAFAAFVVLLPRFERLPDAGVGVSKTVGLVVVTSAVFVANTWLGIRVGLVLVSTMVGALVGCAGWLAHRRRTELATLWHERRAVLLTVEATCVAAFGAVLALRAANPDLWHPNRSGEKPFEQMVLTSVLRSDNLPPFDAWFSNGVSNYYYGGYLLLTAPARLLRTAPPVAMNIGVAVFAMCAAGAAATCCGALVAGGARRRLTTRRAVSALVAGGVALLAANVASIQETWRHIRGDEPFDWWALSRVVPETTDITEFPAWTFLFADLHPHLMAVCLMSTAFTMAIVTYRELVDGPSSPERGGVWALGAWGMLLGVTIGTVRATNTWDLPLTAGMTVVAVASAANVHRRRGDDRWWRRPSVVAAGFLVGWLAWLPYTQRGLVFDGGAQRASIHTPWMSWFEHFGWFAAVGVLAVLPHVRAAIRRSAPGWRGLSVGALNVAGVMLVIAGSIMIWPDSAVFCTTALLAVSTGLLAWRSRHADPRSTSIALGANALAWTIQVGVEAITIRNDIGRQNTVFKFWFESWILLAISSAALLVMWVADRSLPRVRRVGSLGLAGAALAMSATFIAFAVPTRVDDRVSVGGWSLDGEQYLTSPGPIAEAATSVYQGTSFLPAEDLGLIEWVRANVEGGRVVAEASGDDYLWTGRLGALTGTLSPVGWRFHEVQQRRTYGPEVDRRYADFRTLYSTADPVEVARVLATFEVDLVAFGTVERALASPASAVRTHECLQQVFVDGATWVATVDQECAWVQWRAALVSQIQNGE